MNKSMKHNLKINPRLNNQRHQKKSLPPISNYTLPGEEDITRVELPNGIVVLARPNFNSVSLVVSGYVPVGGLLDPIEKLGLANFTSIALMRGTRQHSFQALYDLLESNGASLGFDCATHSTSFGGKALSEDLELLLTVISETLRYPIFPKEHIERLRAQLLTGLAMRAQDTTQVASLTLDQLIYTNHPYRNPEDGYVETIQAITQEDLIACHRQAYGPQGSVIVIVGAIDPQKAIDKVAEFLGDWNNPDQLFEPELPPITPLTKTNTKKVEIAGKSQADIYMGIAGPSRFSPDYMAAALGNNILGQFGMMGRIGEAVREQAGLAYYAHSNLSGGLGPGPWSVSAGVDPSNVDQAIDLITQEIKRFVETKVSPEELSDSQANFIGRLPLSMESNAGVASALINLERYKLGLDYYQNFPSIIEAITIDDVKEVAARYFNPDCLGIAVAGP
ncbi:MAG: insulinase family protein [Anaerolineales bacterium]|nr:insulinase family protein [Anaerolineales bacterium]